MGNFTEQQRLFDLATYTLEKMRVKVVNHSGKVRDAQPFYRHWATEMTTPGWYILVHNDQDSIMEVMWVTDTTDEFTAIMGACVLVIGELSKYVEELEVKESERGMGLW